MISKGHATPVPSEEIHGQRGHVWYLPHFGVYHPKKPTKVRVVFDASAEFDGVSLNKVLLPGPDLMNSLLGVLIRFRRERVGVMCDLEQMFYSFYVNPEHRDYLRFLWYKDNDPQKQVIEYRMNVHLFGNGPSPAVATFGLRKTAVEGEEKYGEEVKDFVHRNFYVNYGVSSYCRRSYQTCHQCQKRPSIVKSKAAQSRFQLRRCYGNPFNRRQSKRPT